MSIIGAIAVGAGLGTAVSNYLFNYTKNEYEQKIGELDRLIAQLNTHLETLISLREEMPSFWEDEQAKETSAALDLTIQKVRDNMKTAQSLSNTFKKTVSSLDGSKSVLHGFIQDAVGALSTIGK